MEEYLTEEYLSFNIMTTIPTKLPKLNKPSWCEGIKSKGGKPLTNKVEIN